MIVLIATDFPDPVAPAMRRWGILARSVTTGLPSRSRPRAIGITARERSHSGGPSSSRSGVGLGVLCGWGLEERNGREEGRFGGGGTRGRTGGRPLPGGLRVAPADTGERSWGADLVFVRFGRRGR